MHDALTNVYLKIYSQETMLNRPVAARQRRRRGPFPTRRSGYSQATRWRVWRRSAFPDAARKKYTFRPTAKPVAASLATGKFGDARKAFEELTNSPPTTPQRGSISASSWPGLANNPKPSRRF